MTLIYNLGIQIYFLLILFFSLFNKKAKSWLTGRKKIFENLESKIDPNSKYAWFHASSLGEFEQGRPVIESLKKVYPEVKIILTFFSPSGYEIRKSYQEADIVSYMPLDTPANAKKFIELVKPQWTFFIKYEFWYNFLKRAKHAEGRLFLISGIFRENQLFFKWYGGWYRQMLSWFDQIFVQNEESRRLLNSINLTNHQLAGDSRFDRVVQIAAQQKDIESARVFARNHNVIVAGSTWPADEDILIEYINSADEKIRMIIAPHEINQSHLDSIISKTQVPTVLYSNLNISNIEHFRILIIDNIGMLSSLYRYGQIAYIGGGFGNGIHNSIEAAVYGLPVIFGPRYQKFLEAVELINCGGAFSINNFNEFENIVSSLLTSESKMTESGNMAGQFVSNRIGATDKIINYLKKN